VHPSEFHARQNAGGRQEMTTDTLAENLRLRLAYLDASWEELAVLAGESPANVRGWVRRGTPRGDTLTRLARLLGVPEHELLNPDFNPRDYPAPDHDGGTDAEAKTDRDQQHGRDGEALP
jgi:transcriptional regulator with XRE-family HTH domain